MPDHYDRLENRSSAARESALFRDLRHVLTVAKPRVPALRAQLKGIEIGKLLTRSDLARIPVLRQADILALQAESQPFGGLCAARLGALDTVFIGPDGLIAPAGRAKDWWGVGRALFAAGLRRGSLVLNCFPYDLVAHGHMIESGAQAICCPVIPAGNADLARKIDAVVRLRPTFFCGEAQHLKSLLDAAHDAGADTSTLRNALVTGPMKAGLRHELELRERHVCHAFMVPELGLVAYESGDADGLLVNEGLIVEIVEPGTDRAAAPEAHGEIVVTRINVDYPLLRYATGFLSAIVPRPSTCGRTNLRIRTPHELARQSADVCGRHIDIAHILEIAKRHPDIGRIRLTLRRPRERDEVHLRIEHAGGDPSLDERLGETFHTLTRLRSTVELVEPGSLSDDDAVIVDERPPH